jgi:low temperature requirement protein LtrA
MVLAGALWWLYFDSVAEVNLPVLELSGGSPTMARAIFAVGHMLPAFALLVTASGVGLLLEDDPPLIAYNLACVGVGLYTLGTRVIRMGSARVPAPVRVLLVVATFALGRLFHGLGAYGYLWFLTAWVLVCAALTTRAGTSDDAPRALPPARAPGAHALSARGGTRTHTPFRTTGFKPAAYHQISPPGQRLLV